jgi:hypothetical protein
MPPKSKVLTQREVLALPPMLFGHIRGQKGLGAPIGDPATGLSHALPGAHGVAISHWSGRTTRGHPQDRNLEDRRDGPVRRSARSGRPARRAIHRAGRSLHHVPQRQVPGRRRPHGEFVGVAHPETTRIPTHQPPALHVVLT